MKNTGFKQKPRKPLKRTPLKKKTVIKKIGKIGKANIEARQRIAEVAEEKGLNYCEIGLPGCRRYRLLSPAHRHKRAWYKGDVELLSDFQEWVSACVTCHDQIEHNKELTEEVFKRLRP